MSNPAPTLNQINAFNVAQGTTIDFNIIGGTEVIRSNKIYIYDLSDNSLICTHLYVSTESIHELPPNTSSSIVYASGKSSADFTNNTQYYAQIQTFTDTSGTQGASGLSIAKLFWCLPTPTLTLSTIPTTISTTSYNVSATYTPNTSGSATNEIQEFQFNLYSAIGALLQTSGVVLYGEGVDLSYNFSGLEVDSTYYVTLDVTTTQGMNVSAQSNTFTVSIDTPTMGSASVVNNGCDGYISVTSNLSSEYEHEESSGGGEIMSFTTDSVNDITELDVDFSPIQDGTPWMSAQDTEPYMFRPVPTQTEDFGYESGTIVGGTVGWNQLIGNGSWYGNIVNGITVVSDSNTGTITVSGTATNFVQFSFTYPQAYLLEEHVYYLAQPNGANGSTYYIRTGESTFWNYKYIGKIATTSNLASGGIRIVVQSGQTVNFTFRPQLFDLTQMFGSTIADYIYSLESGTAGAGVAWLKENAPQLFEYNEYDAGSLVSVSGLTSHDMVGFNQWDEEWENGSPDGTANYIVSKNFSPCVEGATYYFKCGDYTNMYYMAVYWFDENETQLSYTYVCHSTAVAPTGAKYFKVRTNSSTYVYGGTYLNDICVNVSDASLNGTYKPYTKHSYPLDSTLTLRGIPKLDASNNLYYDGDEYEPDGIVTRKYGIVDLGTLDYTFYSYDDNSGGYSSGIASMTKKYPTMSTVPNAISNKQRVVSDTIFNTTNSGKDVTINAVGSVKVTCPNVTSAAELKTAMSGVYLVYELATTTTETADPYTNPQIVDPHGTEQYVGSSIPVGHKTTYQRICPISGWDSVEVNVVGKNFVDITSVATTTTSNWGVSVSGNVLTAEHKNTYSTGTPRTTDMELKAGTYCISYTASTNIVVNVYVNDSWLKAVNTGGTFTLSADSIVYITFPNPQATTITYQNVQLESGSTPTSYVPYNPNSTTYTSTFPKYKQQVAQDKIPYITKDIGDTYADTLTENLVGGTIAWNQSVPDTTTTHTVSGSIASMDDAVAGNFESVVCDITPVQDLHGYDKPWIGGAGANKWDEEWESGSYRSADGVPTTDENRIRSKNKIEVISDDMYLVTLASTLFFFYDANDEYLGYKSQSTNGVITPMTWYPNAKYIRFSVGSSLAPVTTYTRGIAINYPSTVTTYSPWENLCPITGWTGCEVDVAGKNFVLATMSAYLSVGAGFAQYINGSAEKSIAFECIGGVEYTVSGINGNRFVYGVFDSAPTSGTRTTTYESMVASYPMTFTPTKSGYCVVYVSNTSIDLDTIQVEVGSSASPYEPHEAPTTYPVSWQTEAGTVYGGTVDLVTGVLTVDRATVDLGSIEWYKSTSPQRFESAVIADALPPATIQTAPNFLCTAYNPTAANVTDNGVISMGTSGSLRVYDSDKYATMSRGEFKTAVSGVILCYTLATPQTYQLDPVQVACLLGQNNVWNNISNTTVTYPTNHSYQSLSTTHKYYKRINGVESISVGSDVVVDVGTDNIIDLTQMFGTTIADYIYNIEQSSSSGMGVKFFKSLFPNDDYDYNSGTLISVNASAHVIKDADGNVLHTYPLDSDLVLRGIPKLDANNKLYYDGDVYASDGTVTRRYGIVDLGTLSWGYNSTYAFFYATLLGQSLTYNTPSYMCAKYAYGGWNSNNADMQNVADKTIWKRFGNGLSQPPNAVYVKDFAYSDAATFKAAMSGVYLVYEKATTTTEQADPFEENQAIVPNGIGEYIVTEQGDVEMPVGHDSTYYATEIYGGTIDMAKGVLTIDRKVVNLESLSFVQYGSDTVYYASIPNKAYGNTNILSDKFFVDNVAISNMADGSMRGYSTSATVYFRKNDCATLADWSAWLKNSPTQLVYELETPIEISLTPQQMQTLSGQNNIWGNTNGGMYLVYQLPITALLVKRRDVADISGKWLTLYSIPITQASDMDFTFIDFLNQYGKTYQYALVPVLAQDQSGVIVQIEGGYTVSDNVDSIFDGVYIADQTNVERIKAGVGYGDIDMNQGVGSITPIGSKYPIVITNSQNQYHNGSIRGTIVPNDFYSNGNLSRIDMVNKRDELEQFLTNKRAKIIKDWNGKMWLVMIMSNVNCSFDDNYGMGMVSFSADWLEVGDPTNQQDLYNAGLINVGGV